MSNSHSTELWDNTFCVLFKATACDDLVKAAEGKPIPVAQKNAEELCRVLWKISTTKSQSFQELIFLYSSTMSNRKYGANCKREFLRKSDALLSLIHKLSCHFP